MIYAQVMIAAHPEKLPAWHFASRHASTA